MKHFFAFLIALVIVPTTFSIIFYCNADSFAYSDPQNIHFSKSFLKIFFKETCDKSWKNNPHWIDESDSGCTYHYIRPALAYLRTSTEYVPYIQYFPLGLDTSEPQITDGLYVNFAMDLGTSYRFSFKSYENSILQLRYFQNATFEEEQHPEAQIKGIVSVDLSNLKKMGDPILVRFIPYIAFDEFLLKPIEQVNFEELKNRRQMWGEVLGLGLLGLTQPGAPSMTIGQDNSYWKLNAQNELLLDLKNYFENGSMKYSDYSEFLIYSFQILTASSTGQVAPNSASMRFLVSLESLCGIIFLGIAVGLFSEFIPPRKR